MWLFDVMEFFDALVRYEVELWTAVDRELERQGQVRLGSLHALRLLAVHKGRARVQELSEGIGITVGAASKLVDRLERDGLAVRSPNPANRRSSLISLTAAGQRALTSAMVVLEDSLDRALGPEDVAVVTAALKRLQSRLSTSGIGMAA